MPNRKFRSHFQTSVMAISTVDVLGSAATDVTGVSVSSSSTHTTVTRTYPTSPSSPSNNIGDGNDGPSWGLIIPILLIGFFLVCVAFCLYWHKWRNKRPRGINLAPFPRYHSSVVTGGTNLIVEWILCEIRRDPQHL